MKTTYVLALLTVSAALRAGVARADDVRFSFSFGFGAPTPVGFYVSNVPVRPPPAPCPPVAVVAPVCAPAPVVYVPVARPIYAPACPSRPVVAVAPRYGYRPYPAPVVMPHHGGRGHRGHGHVVAYTPAPGYYRR